MKKIVFFGSGYYVIPIIKSLKSLGLKLVVTNQPDGELISYLQKEDIPYIYSNFKNKEDIKKIKEINPDIGVLASYGAFIPQEIINLFPLGILNIHPSLLPKYKGPSPIQYTILNGDTVCGISIILLDDQIDHGPIIKQKEIHIADAKTTAKELTELAFLDGAEMVKDVIQNVNNGIPIQSFPQDIKSESWTQKVEKIDGKISINNPPNIEELDRKIRAFYPWPGVYLTVTLGGKNRFLKLMPNDTVQVEGKNPMSYKDFMNGYKEGKDVLQKLNLLQ